MLRHVAPISSSLMCVRCAATGGLGLGVMTGFWKETSYPINSPTINHTSPPPLQSLGKWLFSLRPRSDHIWLQILLKPHWWWGDKAQVDALPCLGFDSSSVFSAIPYVLRKKTNSGMPLHVNYPTRWLVLESTALAPEAKAINKENIISRKATLTFIVSFLYNHEHPTPNFGHISSGTPSLQLQAPVRDCVSTHTLTHTHTQKKTLSFATCLRTAAVSRFETIAAVLLSVFLFFNLLDG